MYILHIFVKVWLIFDYIVVRVCIDTLLLKITNAEFHHCSRLNSPNEVDQVHHADINKNMEKLLGEVHVSRSKYVLPKSFRYF